MSVRAVNVLTDAFHGERDWNIQDLSLAWANLTLFIFGKFFVIAGTAVLAVGVILVGGATLLVTLGELVWRWFQGQFAYQPFLCDYYGVTGGTCVASLAAWHLGTLCVFWLMVYRGDAMLDRAALFLNRFRT